MISLPENFLECIKKTLGEDYAGYLDSLSAEPFRGLRVNTLKANADILHFLPFKCSPAPFCTDGYYISGSLTGIGNHPLHHAGAFYMQEPSAMCAVTALDVQKGDRVLDLCAAPGGKSTQIASALGGTGLLVANEIISSRAKTLCSNLERLGVRNSVVTNARPDELEQSLAGFFDKILVDAPCSGEGMIRREPNAAAQWKQENREACALRQLKILNSADRMLKAGGALVYSTCTLSGEENEAVIDRFLETHTYYEIDEIKADFGRAAYARFAKRDDITRARRILPQDGGEGHFAARLIKREDTGQSYTLETVQTQSPPEFEAFLDENFEKFSGVHAVFSDGVTLLPEKLPKITGARVIRRGVPAGRLCKNRFEPSHALYMAALQPDLKNRIDLTPDSREIRCFLHGEEIECDAVGYTAVTVCGITVGFGKASRGKLKNHYPKGLRILG